VCGQERITGYLRLHRAIAYDEVREDREHGCAHCTLNAPDGETTQPDTDVMRVAGETPTPATGRRMCELKAKGQEKGQDALDKCLAIVKQAKVPGFILEINGDRAVVPCLCGCCAPCVTPRCSGLVS
jgi:hypothetical protein